MSKPYNEITKAAKYKLTGHGNRCVGSLMEALEQMDPGTESDIYGTGRIINDFEAEIAQLLGKESAIFFPSGTMAQQIALRIWSDQAELKTVAYHPLCHLEIHEQDGVKLLHHLKPVLLGEADRLFTIEDLKSVSQPLFGVLVELPQREIGGQLPSWEELVELSQYCKDKSIKLHLDGARLFEVLPYYNKSASEVCSLFDSAYVSFYKGLGGIAGAALAGSQEFMEQAKVWKRRHGGDLISLYPYVISAKYGLNKRMGQMEKYWQHALVVAERLNNIEGINTVPMIPICNMFHVYFAAPKAVMENIFLHIIEKHNLSLVANLKEIDESSCKYEMTFGDSFGLMPQELLDEAFNQLEAELKGLIQA